MPLPINFNAVLSELLAQFLFVFICASAASAPIASIAAVPKITLLSYC